MAERQLPKLHTRVRSPSPAPNANGPWPSIPLRPLAFLAPSIPPLKEPLHKPHADRVACEIGMIARSATKVVAWTTMPRSATKRAPDFAATRMGWGFSGGLRRCSACEYVELFAAPRALHPIPKSLHRDRAGFMQRFLSCSLPRVTACNFPTIALIGR